MSEKLLCEGQILTGSLIGEPMRLETVRAKGPDTRVAGLFSRELELRGLAERILVARPAKLGPEGLLSRKRAVENSS